MRLTWREDGRLKRCGGGGLKSFRLKCGSYVGSRLKSGSCVGGRFIGRLCIGLRLLQIF